MIAPHTVALVEGLLRPLTTSGAIDRGEVHEVVTVLRSAASCQTEVAETKKLLTRAEAAQRLRLSTKTISRMLEAGELEGRYLRRGSPRTLRITSQSIDRIESGSFI